MWDWSPHTNTWHLKTLMISHILIMQHVMGIQKLSKSWPLWQTILKLQITLDILQFICQQDVGIQKLSKSWPLYQTILMQITMELLQFKILFPLTENPKAPKWGKYSNVFCSTWWLFRNCQIIDPMLQMKLEELQVSPKWKNSKISWIFQYF